MTIPVHSPLANVVFNNQITINIEPFADLGIIFISTLQPITKSTLTQERVPPTEFLKNFYSYYSVDS